MTPADVLAEARRSLSAHPLRTGLASLGVVVGVATVIAALAIAEGARRVAIADVSALGVNNLFARATPRAVPGRPAPAPALTRGDAAAIAQAAGASAAAMLRFRQVEVTAGSRATTAAFVGTTATWRQISGLRVAEGRWLADEDVGAARQAAVIGAALARRLAPDGLRPGAVIAANGSLLRVVGILESSGVTAGGAALQLFDTDNAVFVPIDLMDASLGQGDSLERLSAIALRLPPNRAIDGAASAMRGMLARRQPGSGAEVEILEPRALLRARLQAQRTFDMVLLATGLVALLISGVGIMNIMLATVAERTAEIGIRRAFGARRAHIIRQFAVEAALLCVAGSAAGLPLGAGFAWAVSVLSHWPVTVSAGSVILALVLAGAVGLGFGIYPARRAAFVDPIEALRA